MLKKVPNWAGCELRPSTAASRVHKLCLQVLLLLRPCRSSSCSLCTDGLGVGCAVPCCGAARAAPGAMAMSVERSCTFLVHFDKAASQSEVKEALEGSDAAAKVQAMQKAIMMLLNGETLPALFITIVRYVLPSEDHTIQKLLLLYLVRLLRPGFVALVRPVHGSALSHMLPCAGDY